MFLRQILKKLLTNATKYEIILNEFKGFISHEFTLEK